MTTRWVSASEIEMLYIYNGYYDPYTYRTSYDATTGLYREKRVKSKEQLEEERMSEIRKVYEDEII
jgi:hypothetical protein